MSSSSNNSGSKTERDKQKMIQDKCQLILTQMLRDEDNKYCVDCDAKGPRWASWNLGIFLCIRCAGIHRNLGVHISKVKSVNLDSWTPEQVVSLQQMGNSRARAVYEANLPDNFKRPQFDSALESFIRAKYESKRYIAKEWVQPPPVKVSWDAEIEMELKRKKEAKRKGTGSSGSVELPTSTSSAISVSRTTSSSTNSKPAVTKESPMPVAPIPAPTAVAKPSQDLLGLDVVNASSGDDIFGGLLGGTQPATSTPSASNGSANTAAGGKDSEEDSFFNQKAPSASEKRTLDKNSILALYNQGSGSQAAIQQPQQMATPAQQQMNVSMFATPHSGVSMYATPPTHPHAGHPGVPPAMGSFGQSPGLQQLGSNVPAGAQFNPMLQGNHLFSSPMFASTAPVGLNQQHSPLNPASNINQLSQQMMSGLQLGGPTASVTASPMMQPVNPMMHSGLNGGLAAMANTQMGAFGVMGGQPMNQHAMTSTAMPSYPNLFLGSNMPAAAPSSSTGHSLSTNLWQ